MKKLLSALLVFAMLSACLTSCKPKSAEATNFAGTELRIVTAYGSDDGNHAYYTGLLNQFQKDTGAIVTDDSSSSNEEWKAKVNGDFQADNEPDVLMYFTGYDANEIIRSGKVVSIREIQAEYPEYGQNMREEMMPASIVDGQNYAIPVNGYWEAMFVNKDVLEKCNITDVPNADTTWSEFLLICEQIKQEGYTPISVSLSQVPHYLVEYAVFNEGNANIHSKPPTRADDLTGLRWIKGLNTIKSLYEMGYLPENTLTLSDSDAFWQFCTGRAAFIVDGSWRIGWLAGTYNDKREQTSKSRVPNLEDFTVTYVPGSSTRLSTDIISGISMGFFITRRAWDNPQKREAAVRLVETLTSNEAITTLSQGAPTALKEVLIDNFDVTALHKDAQELLLGATSATPAAQDVLSKPTRTYLFDSVKNIVTGKMSAYDALDSALTAPILSAFDADT